MASYSPGPGQVLHYPQPHDPPLAQPMQQPDYQPQQQEYQPYQPEIPETPQQPFPETPQFAPQQPPQFQPPPFQPPPFQQPFLDPSVMPPPMMPLPYPPPFFPPPMQQPPPQQMPLWTPFHMQALIPSDTPAHRIIPADELAAIVPLRTDTHVDRDLALLITKAHKYGGAIPGGHRSHSKYEKYTFLAGLLLAKRGLPAVAVPDDPDDAYVKLLQVYLSNTSRLGADPDSVLIRTLAKGGRYYDREESGSRRSRSESRRSRRSSRARSASRKSGSRKSGSRKSGRSGSRRRSERKSSSRNCSSSDTSDWDM